MALHSLYCADVPLRNCSLTQCGCCGDPDPQAQLKLIFVNTFVLFWVLDLLQYLTSFSIYVLLLLLIIWIDALLLDFVATKVKMRWLNISRISTAASLWQEFWATAKTCLMKLHSRACFLVSSKLLCMYWVVFCNCFKFGIWMLEMNFIFVCILGKLH